MADLRISQLSQLSEAALQAGDELAIVDASASETKKIQAKDLVQKALSLVDSNSIPADKVSGSISPGSIGTTELANKSVTAIKLADSSSARVGSSVPAAGAFTGQMAFQSPSHTAYVWDGSNWQSVDKGVATITGGKVGDVTTTVTTVGDASSVIASVDNSSVAAEFLAGPTASAGAVELRTIVPADLPVATNSSGGIVTVPDGSGLTIDNSTPGSSELSIDNDITGSTDFHLTTYSDKGLVSGGRAIEAGDLPLATSGSVGAISAGEEFTVDGNGELKLANQISGSTHTKVTYNDQGNITSGENLDADDIPSLNADKITEGTLPTDRIAAKAITKEKLANFATAYIQEAQPSIVDSDPTGILWYQESTAQLRINNSNSWRPVGFGRLSQDNLRWGGVINASNGEMTGVTESGTTAGLSIGDPLPAATDALGGLYVVVGVAGNSIGVTPGLSYDAGDWCLCINATEGWVRIDTLSGGGGGGGVDTLGALLDVTIASPTEDEFLQYQSNGQWQNVAVTPASIGALAPGDDVSELNNDAGYITAGDVPAAPVTSVNGETGEVVLSADDVGALEAGDNVSELTNDAGYITAGDIPTPPAVLWSRQSDTLYPQTTTDDVVIGGLPGGGNITLASDGKATFADNVSTTNGVFYATRSSSAGSAFVGRTGTTEGIIITADGTTKIGGTLPSTPNIELNANGSGSFNNTVDIGPTWVNSGPAIRHTFTTNTGNLGASTWYAENNVGSADAIILRKRKADDSGWDAPLTLSYGGNINAVGMSNSFGAQGSTSQEVVKVNGSGGVLRLGFDADGNQQILARAGQSTKRLVFTTEDGQGGGGGFVFRTDLSESTISKTGDVAFAGNGAFGDPDSSDDTDKSGVSINKAGSLYIQRLPGNASSTTGLTIYEGDEVNGRFASDGSIIAAGGIQHKNATGSKGGVGVNLSATGCIFNYKNSNATSTSDAANANHIVFKAAPDASTSKTTVFRVDNSGAMTSAGPIKTTSFFNSTRTQGSEGIISGNLNATQTFKVTAEGSVFAAGSLKIGGTSSAPAAEITSDGKTTLASPLTLKGVNSCVLSFHTTNTKKEWYNNESNGQFAYYDRDASKYTFAFDHADQSVYIGSAVNNSSGQNVKIQTDGRVSTKYEIVCADGFNRPVSSAEFTGARISNNGYFLSYGGSFRLYNQVGGTGEYSNQAVNIGVGASTGGYITLRDNAGDSTVLLSGTDGSVKAAYYNLESLPALP